MKNDLLAVLAICIIAWVLTGCLSWLAISCPLYRYACATLISLAAGLITTHQIHNRMTEEGGVT